MPDQRRNNRNRSPSLQRRVEFLRRPDSYPDETSQVRTVETHMSWVFLTDRFAYKLKKPVRMRFLDFSTLAARERDCRDELRLNRRLAPQIYLAVVALAADPGGTFRLEGEGEIVDWLVKMHRLPGADLLDAVIAAGPVDEARVRGAAAKLAHFYADLPPVRLGQGALLQGFEQEIREHRSELARPEFGLPECLVESVTSAQARFVREQAELLRDRVRQGRIVEGHGDLRPEHIHVGDPPAVIDCLEFNRDFRIVDPADELSFLWMECAFLGAADVGKLFWEAYVRTTGDPAPEILLDFYRSHRACLRAKLSVWHLHDPETGAPDKWRARALKYLTLASDYADRLFLGAPSLEA